MDTKELLAKLPADTKTEDYHGAKKYLFTFQGREAWIVEGDNPMDENYFFWVPEWPNAFPRRNGAYDLLKLGYYMIYINIRGLCASPEAMEIMKQYFDFLQTLGFARKTALIGMSLGGLYSLRYGETYPETVSCIYADAPACDLYYRHRVARFDTSEICKAYSVEEDAPEKLMDHPLSPLLNYMPMVENRIPVLMILGGADTILPPELNGRLFAQRYKEASGNVTLLERASWGHHPHGLDDPSLIVQFILKNTLNKV